MSTKFNSLSNRGGQIIFALTLFATLLPMFSFGQPGLFTIYGEGLWRNQGYGVANHQFDIENYIVAYLTNYPLDPDPTTASCPNEVYTTEEMPLYSVNYNTATNTLKIRPYSVNNAADYRNGVSTIDLNYIQAHIIDSVPFEDRIPTEDFPYRYISADADYDHDIDSDDIDMIQDLILFLRDDLTRNSWEWVHKDEVEEAEERFEDSPYEFVIDYNWPGADGIVLSSLTTNQILGDNDKYFTFRTTKIGDIFANSSYITSLNTWVCGSGAYLTEGPLESRSVNNQNWEKIRAGCILTVGLDLQNEEDIYSLEIPIAFDENDFEMIDISFQDGFSPRWHRNPEKGTLVFSDFSRTLLPMNIPTGRIVEFKLKAKRNISDVKSEITWHPDRSVELGGAVETILDPQISLEIIEILPPDLFAEIRNDNSYQQLFIESPKLQVIDFMIYNYLGHLIYNESLELSKGVSVTDVPTDLIPGLYVISLESESESAVLKWIKH